MDGYVKIDRDDLIYLNSSINNISSDYVVKHLITEQTFINSDDIEIAHYIDEDSEETITLKTRYLNGDFYISNHPDIINDFYEFKDSMVRYLDLTDYYTNKFNDLADDCMMQKEFLINLIGDDFQNPDFKDFSTSYYNYAYFYDDLTNIQRSLAIKCLIHYKVYRIIGDIKLLFILPPSLTFEEINEKEKQDLN